MTTPGDVGASPEDLAEQAADRTPELPLEADEADAAEQALVVELDEDEDR